MTVNPSEIVSVQRSDERYSADYGWLRTHHAFSADYADPDKMHWGALHVFNDDNVAPGEGFARHPHRDMEIITYVLDGALEHHDSLGNHGVVQSGGVQYMSAGTGVVHSEYNASPTDPLRFLQMWIPPRQNGLKPVYGQIDYTVADRRNRWLTIASGMVGQSADVTLNRDAVLLVSRLESATLRRDTDAMRLAFLFVATGDVRSTVLLASGDEVKTVLTTGDALRIGDASALSVEGSGEIVFWDLPKMESFW